MRFYGNMVDSMIKQKRNRQKIGQGPSGTQLHRKVKYATRGTERNSSTVAKRIILIVIALVIVVAVTGILSAWFKDDEKTVKRQIEEMSAEYYENFIYPHLADGKNETEIFAAFEKYKEIGFARVSLRQLLLHDARNNAEKGELIKKYCNENATSVKIYPEEPYKKESYRVDYIYACEF